MTTTIEKLKLLTTTPELVPTEVEAQFPECVEYVSKPRGGTDLQIKDLDIVLLKAILELDARLAQVGV